MKNFCLMGVLLERLFGRLQFLVLYGLFGWREIPGFLKGESALLRILLKLLRAEWLGGWWVLKISKSYNIRYLSSLELGGPFLASVNSGQVTGLVPSCDGSA